jgi:Uma2 family endonuclease
MTALPPPMTADEFVLLPDEGKGYELIDGRLREQNMSKESSRFGGRVVRYLSVYSDDHGGWVYESDLGYRIFGTELRVRRSDASYVSFASMPVETYTDEGYCTTCPDLVAEVLSPYDLANEVDAKIDDWLGAGVKVVWILQPVNRTIRIIRNDGSTSMLREKDTLTEPTVLPGFSVPVADIFRIPKPPIP